LPKTHGDTARGMTCDRRLPIPSIPRSSYAHCDVVGMKATITFSLPEEREEFELANNAGKYHSALWAMASALRNHAKHGDADVRVSWDDVRVWFYETLKDAEVEL